MKNILDTIVSNNLGLYVCMYVCMGYSPKNTKGGKSYLSYSHPLKTSERRLNASLTRLAYE